MSKTIDFYYDFASPNVYLADKVLPAIAERHNAEINYIPCLLGGIFKSTGNQAPMMAFGPIKGKLAYEMLEMQRFIDKHRLSAFEMNPHFPIHTLPLMRGYIAAIKEGVESQYRSVVAKAMWEDGLAMGEPEVIAKTLSAGGLDAERLMALTQEPDIKAALAENTQVAVGKGIFGLPAWFVDADMFFGKERLGQLEEALSG